MKKYLAFAAMTIVAAPVYAALVCVDPANTPPCLATIQAGINAAVAGDTVAVAPGIYHEALSIPAGKNGLTLSGNAKKTIIDGANLASVGLTVDSASVKLASFIIRHTFDDSIALNPTATGSSLTNVTVQNAGSDGIYIEATDVTLTGCKVTVADNQCIWSIADRTTIQESTAFICDDGCIRVSGNDMLVQGNTVSQCEDDPAVDAVGDRARILNNNLKLAEDGVDLYCDPCTQGLISGNTIAHSQDNNAGIYATANPGGIVIDGNTITDSTDTAIKIQGSGVVVRANTIARIGDEPVSCVDASGTGHTITDNGISDCHGDGIRTLGSGHQLTGNSVSNGVQDGIDIESDSTQVSDNTTKGNGYEGIEISTGTTGNSVNDNTSSKNRADYCNEGAGTITGNNAFATTSPCSVD